MIMDMLGNPKLRQIITESYQSSSEPKRVRDAITEAGYGIVYLGIYLILRKYYFIVLKVEEV